MTSVPIEPHADIREIAANAMQLYVAFTEAGFDVNQSLQLVKAILSAQVRGGT